MGREKTASTPLHLAGEGYLAVFQGRREGEKKNKKIPNLVARPRERGKKTHLERKKSEGKEKEILSHHHRGKGGELRAPLGKGEQWGKRANPRGGGGRGGKKGEGGKRNPLLERREGGKKYLPPAK